MTSKDIDAPYDLKFVVTDSKNHESDQRNHLQELLELEYKWAQGIEEQVLFSNKEFRLLELEFKIKKRRILLHQQHSSCSSQSSAATEEERSRT